MNLQCTKNLVVDDLLIMKKDVICAERLKETHSHKVVYFVTILISQSAEVGRTAVMLPYQIAEHFQYTDYSTCRIIERNISIPELPEN
jgi:hypothetical protein